MNDSFAYMLELCHISSSQEEILRHCPFVGQTIDLRDDAASASAGRVPAASTGIATVALKGTPRGGGKDSGPQHVFHSPRDKSSLPASGDQLRSVGFEHCAINKAAEAGFDDETTGLVNFCGYTEAELVDLTDGLDLGFPQLKLRQMVNRESVAECSRGIDEDGVSKASKRDFDQFRFLRGELSSKDGIGESPLKKLKLPEQNPGFDSSQARIGIESQKTKSPCNFGGDALPQHNVVMGKEECSGVGSKENAWGRMPVGKNLGSLENLGSHATQSEIATSSRNFKLHDIEECVKDSKSRGGIFEDDKLPRTGGEGNKSGNEVIEVEASGRQKRADKQPGLRVLPSSILGCLENAAKDKEKGKDNSFVFYVLKSLKGNSNQDNLENVSMLQIAKTSGVTFPRPSWKTKKG